MSRMALEDVAESIPHLVWLADPSGATDYANDRVAEYVGQPREASYGWAWAALLHPEDVERTKAAWVHATTTVTPFDLSYRLRRADGEFRWHRGRALPVRDDDGSVRRWLGTADDVSDLRVALDGIQEQSLRAGDIGDLTPRDLAVAGLVARGHTNVEISSLLGFSVRTIEANRAQLRRVLGLQTRADIVRFALEHDLDATA